MFGNFKQITVSCNRVYLKKRNLCGGADLQRYCKSDFVIFFYYYYNYTKIIKIIKLT